MNNKLPLALVGCGAPKEIFSSLESNGFKVVTLKDDTRLPLPVSSHADMIAFHFENRIFCSEDYASSNTFDILAEYGYEIIKSKARIENEYPRDIAFNLACIDRKIYGNIKFAAKEIIDLADREQIELVNVKQGYTKCSTVVLGSSAIITADDGIAKAAERNGILVLKIKNSPSAVKIEGYDYGFLGGACGVFNNKVYFTGDIYTHPNGKEIVDFCKLLGFDTVCLCQGQLTDVGGIIFLPPLN